jgi:hypothetical protein
MSTAQRVRGRNVSGSELESLGKQAARLGETSGLSLTEACVRTLEHQSLNTEQIRRAVEHCNIGAVNSKFASLRGVDRVVHIDGGPADPVTVMDALNASAAAPQMKIAALEYSTAPSYEKRAMRMPDGPRANIPQLQTKLKQAHDEAVELCAGLEFRMEQRLDELKLAAKHAANEGASLQELAAAWSYLHPKLAQIAAQAMQHDIPWSEGKVAARGIRAEAPVMQKFAAFASVALEFQRGALARNNIESELAKVARFLESRAS